MLLTTRALAVSLGDPTTPVNLPLNSSDAYGVSVAFGPLDGLMYVWDGASVLKQDGFNSDSYTSIGSVNTSGSDAGPITFSTDFSQILLGNGAGGTNPDGNAGNIFAMSAAGENATSPVGNIPFHASFLAAPFSGSNSKYFIDSGTDAFGSGSNVSVFDSTAGASVPAISVINGIPGASTSMTMDSSGRLYVGVGFGPDAGQIRRFSLSDLQNAYNTNTALEWSSGQLFNAKDNNGGAGMFFDARGYLFVGGIQGVTVFDLQGNSEVYSNDGYTSVVYDKANDRFLASGFGDEQGIYSASAFNVHLPGDFNLDGHVDASDVVAMLAALVNLNAYQNGGNSQNATLNTRDMLSIGDLNDDGTVNNADLQGLLNLLLSGGGSVNSVPEPAAWVLAIGAVGCGVLVYYRRGWFEARMRASSA
ncbi:MAG TPA: hypothetical protein VFE46_19515 [Pirellulales bacterium]|jgi:hypothetical protein|nr:hypothetical protein [Pirellulales bacterium]